MLPVLSGSSYVPSTPSRRSFVALSALTGLALPVLAGCDLPGVSKDKGGAASPAGSQAGGSASAGGSATATAGSTKAGSTDWQRLDGHVMGHKVPWRSPPSSARTRRPQSSP